MKKTPGRKSERFSVPAAKDIHFDIDDYLNRIVPPSQLYRLPKPLARFLGYRKEPAKEVGNVVVALWSLLGAFLGLLVVGAVFRYWDAIQIYHPPVLFASLGATAILDYNTIQSPLAQPRAALVGHGFAATVGVSVAKLFMFNSNFHNIRWIAGPLSCGIASFVMAMTNTVHPPGGATAVLAAVDPTIIAMGWMFIPLLLFGSMLMFFVALAINNIQRQFPVFWWTPRDVVSPKQSDIESSGGETEKKMKVGVAMDIVGQPGFTQTIVLNPDRVLIPEGFPLEYEQIQMLEVLRDRLRLWNVTDEETGFVFSGSDTTHVEKIGEP